jgi:hypothetical protein
VSTGTWSFGVGRFGSHEERTRGGNRARDALVAHHRKVIAERGEASVFY